MMRNTLYLVAVFLGAGFLAHPPCSRGGEPINVYRPAAQLPATVRRVAVLPVTIDADDLVTEEGRDALETVLYTELQKRAAADLVGISREQLRDLTGRKEWTTADALSPDFFERLRAATGCDAVVFSRLTHFRAYPPLGVGWNVQLIDTQKRSLWAVDEVFDAGNPAVAAAARRYYVRSLHTPNFCDSSTVLFSPRRFGQFAAAEVSATMPGR
jgi:hypothetical protein